MIKSAFELALERAKLVKVDHVGLKTKELEKSGKIFIAKAIEDVTLNITDCLVPGASDYPQMKDGMLSVLMTNLMLPARVDNMPRLNRIKELFCQIDSRSNDILEQLYMLFDQYLVEKEQVIAQLEEHFDPILRQKEQQITSQTGKSHRLTIESYPEVHQAYRQQMEMFEERYKEALTKSREELLDIFKEAINSL